jgi:hypothetical protein
VAARVARAAACRLEQRAHLGTRHLHQAHARLARWCWCCVWLGAPRGWGGGGGTRSGWVGVREFFGGGGGGPTPQAPP